LICSKRAIRRSVDRSRNRGLDIPIQGQCNTNHDEDYGTHSRARRFGLQTRWLIALEMRIVSREKRTRQSTCLTDDCIRDAPSFNLEKVYKTVDRPGYLAMNKWITANQGNISVDTCGEGVGLSCWIFSFIGQGHLELDPPIYNFFGKPVVFRFIHRVYLFVRFINETRRVYETQYAMPTGPIGEHIS
jgi:hypothetical protein